MQLEAQPKHRKSCEQSLMMAAKSAQESQQGENDSFKPFETTTGVKFVSAGLAASVAEIVTMPIDTSKVRLMVL